MALILCGECGRSISDKAYSCPGCGYPLQPSDPNRTMQIEPVNKTIQIDCKSFSKEELWAKAYNMHYKYKDRKADIPTAINIYNYIIEHFNDSKESEYAKAQLKILTTSSTKTQTATNDITPAISKVTDINESNRNLKEYYKILGLEESASIEEVTSAYNELSEKWNPIKYEVHERSMFPFAVGKFNEINDAYNRINQQLTGDYTGTNLFDGVSGSSSLHSIPNHGGLVALAFIIGFGIIGGITWSNGSSLFGKRTKTILTEGMQQIDDDIIEIISLDKVPNYNDCYQFRAKVSNSAMRVGGVPVQDYVAKLVGNTIERQTYINGGLLETTAAIVCR